VSNRLSEWWHGGDSHAWPNGVIVSIVLSPVMLAMWIVERLSGAES